MDAHAQTDPSGNPSRPGQHSWFLMESCPDGCSLYTLMLFYFSSIEFRGGRFKWSLPSPQGAVVSRAFVTNHR